MWRSPWRISTTQASRYFRHSSRGQRSWTRPGGVASLGDPAHPWYAGIFGVTAQFGLLPNPVDEPMNRSPGSPTIVGGDTSGYNAAGRDRVSGFRSMHRGGCHFLFADGSVHWLTPSIDPAVYRALSTYAGGDQVLGSYD